MTRLSALLLTTALCLPAHAETPGIEKDELTLGFIKLTDMAPLAIAKEKGFFEDEGLSVTLVAQSNWKVLLDGVVSGELDGAHMLAGQPIAASIGYGTKAALVTPFSMDLNGNAITVSNAVWEAMKPNVPMADGKPVHPISAEALKPVIEAYADAGTPFNLGMVFPVSTHNYELRYWLAAGGINPGLYSPDDVSGQIGGDVLISVTPPPQMPATLEAGTILGYAVGEPWNQAAVAKGIGVPVITDADIWKNNPEKVFGLTAEFVDQNPQTTLALTKALIRAAIWLGEGDNAKRMMPWPDGRGPSQPWAKCWAQERPAGRVGPNLRGLSPDSDAARRRNKGISARHRHRRALPCRMRSAWGASSCGLRPNAWAVRLVPPSVTDNGIRPCIRGRKSLGRTVRHDRRREHSTCGALGRHADQRTVMFIRHDTLT